MTSKKYFGTDGIRGCVGDEKINPEFALKLGWAIGKILGLQSPNNKVLIGKDTRVSGYMFESALEAGLLASGFDTLLVGPMPTPAIAYLSRTFRVAAGIVISASHNPFYDNGFKLFSGGGEKFPDAVELAIEEQLEKPFVTNDAQNLGKAQRINDAAGRYIEFTKSTFPNRITLKGFKIAIDCANGATYHVAPSVFHELGAEVIVIGNKPDGFNINKDCGATDTFVLQQQVLAEQADLGIAFDGDGDRVIMVNHLGDVVDGDQILYIIAKMRHEAGLLNGGVVGTVMSNYGLENAFKFLKIPFVRSAVGDRYVLSQLLERGWELGGESSGHIICRHLTTTGDGIISALQVLAAMCLKNKTLLELSSEFEKYPQVMINVKLSRKIDILNNKRINEEILQAEKLLAGNGRVLLRSSGTEPVVRVMVEGHDFQQVNQIAKHLSEIVEAEIA